ncbi:secreted RxLR effector protein 161-like [Primulina huaijiensis]|uniref:secreted RxLR effector protein 161-like n=1 Tax=Primulina huaijiensis TaxID=1492673 RepID=UPI003CC6F7D8
MCPNTLEETHEMSKVPYSSAVGSLMYAMMCTHLDICYVGGLVSRYQYNPGIRHWIAVKRILRYLKGTTNYFLCYQGKDLTLKGYIDDDWGGDLDECKSTSSYAFLLNDGCISWRSKKQTCVSLSTMEAEFVACTSAVQESVWLKRFLCHLGIVSSPVGPLTICCDSQSAIAYTKDPKYHEKTKHIDTKYNFIRDIVEKKEVTLKCIPTHMMVADPFTKSIPRDIFIVSY